jgi:hypothetical protein
MKNSQDSEPYEILAQINNKKSSHQNYYYMLDTLLASSQTQPLHIKLQILYIVGKEYFHFKEYTNSFKYLYKVYLMRNELCVPNIIEDTILHILIIITENTSSVALILYSKFIKKIIPNDILVCTNYMSVEEFELFLRAMDTKYEISYFFNYLFQNEKYDLCVYFLNTSYVDIFIDKLMVLSYYTTYIKTELCRLYFEENVSKLNILLYLIVNDKNDKSKYIAKINSICDDNIKRKIQVFNEKYRTRVLLKLVEPCNTALEVDSCTEEVILFLYKNREFQRILDFYDKIDEKKKTKEDFLLDSNLILNILYFSYFKIDYLIKAEEIYQNIHEILFPVDEIEYLLISDNISLILNKIINLSLPEDYLKVLEMLYKKDKMDILKESILVNIYKYEDINVFKVCLSYLLLYNFNLNYIIHDYLIKHDNILKLSAMDKDWLFKISYNNIIDDIKNINTQKYLEMIHILKGEVLELVFISILACEYISISIYDMFCMYKRCNKDDKELSFNILVLFYDYSIRYSLKDLEDEIYISLNINELSDKDIKLLLGVCTSKNVIIEAHNRGIFTDESLERNIIMNGSKGRLYIFLRSIYIINITKYLNDNIRIILKKEIDLLETYGDFKTVEFYRGILD